MNNQITLKKIIHFPLTKIIIGILVVGGSVAVLGEWISRSLLDKTQLTNELKNVIVGIIGVSVALLSYILLFRFYEKRQIGELS